MVQRPEYPTTTPSIETWEDACVISQNWADDARMAAVKRQKRHRIIKTVTLMTLELAALAGLLYLLLH